MKTYRAAVGGGVDWLLIVAERASGGVVGHHGYIDECSMG
jgi:hypothetical protein